MFLYISGIYAVLLTLFYYFPLPLTGHLYKAPTGAYLHIPFCRRRCFYCDFAIKGSSRTVVVTFYFTSKINNYSILLLVVGDRRTTIDIESEKYTNLITREIKITSEKQPNVPLESVYFGGGTPSLMSPFYFKDILQVLNENIGISSIAEVITSYFISLGFKIDLFKDNIRNGSWNV